MAYTGFLTNLAAWLHPERDDGRGKRFVAVIECLLNQNARDRGAASFPAFNTAVVDLCGRHDVGLLQIACPEIRHLGWRRERAPGTGIRACLDTPAGWQCCREISQETVARMREYVDAGVELLAVLGGNPESPGCAVHMGPAQEPDGDSGILMQTLAKAMEDANIRAPFRGMRDCRPDLLERDLRWLERCFQGSP